LFEGVERESLSPAWRFYQHRAGKGKGLSIEASG
jgi:hypothetical protein